MPREKRRHYTVSSSKPLFDLEDAFTKMVLTLLAFLDQGVFLFFFSLWLVLSVFYFTKVFLDSLSVSLVVFCVYTLLSFLF